MQKNLYPLDNYGLFISEMPKEIIEYYILTKGKVVRKFSSRLERIGAKVIGGIVLGKNRKG